MAAAVRRLDFDASLAPCNLAAHAQWRQLSGHITPGDILSLWCVVPVAQSQHGVWTVSAPVADVIERHSPLGGNISVTAEADPALLAPNTQAEACLAEQLQTPLRFGGALTRLPGSRPAFALIYMGGSLNQGLGGRGGARHSCCHTA